jgi:hypothetical protein
LRLFRLLLPAAGFLPPNPLLLSVLIGLLMTDLRVC